MLRCRTKQKYETHQVYAYKLLGWKYFSYKTLFSILSANVRAF